MKQSRIAWLALPAALLVATTVLATLLIVDARGESSIGKAAPRNGDVRLPLLKDGRILAANKWPDACTLVDEEDVKAVLPDAEDLRQEQRRVYVPSIKDFAADSSWKESNSSDSGQCDYEMRLPGQGLPVIPGGSARGVRCTALAALAPSPLVPSSLGCRAASQGGGTSGYRAYPDVPTTRRGGTSQR
ncbi:hypothetical protein OHU45_00560 [Streptomyces tubercidicus]|uniref:hypothetical protein n=1 Tax=Streptomyces tubercidicus TaxID=47759 RepID=UPI0030DE9A65